MIIFHEEKLILKNEQKSTRFFKELTPNHNFETKSLKKLQNMN